MRILVTGAHGQVVTSLLERAPLGVEVVAMGRPDLDLADPASIANAFDGEVADLVVNAAAFTAVDKAESEEALATRVNGEGAGLVAGAARALGAPIIQLSTDYVFDGAADRPYREDDPTGPIGAYGRSKLAGEEAVAAANPRHVILRTAWVYSPFGANFVKTMLRLGETRREVRVVADQFREPDQRARHRRCGVPDRRDGSDQAVATDIRSLPYDRRRRGELGGVRGSDLREGPRARPPGGESDWDRDRRLSDAGPKARQFPTRRRTASA